MLLRLLVPSIRMRSFFTTATGMEQSCPRRANPHDSLSVHVCRCCVLSVISSAQASTLTSETVTSLTLEHLYTWAGASCYSFTGAFGDGLQACQVRNILRRIRS